MKTLKAITQIVAGFLLITVVILHRDAKKTHTLQPIQPLKNTSNGFSLSIKIEDAADGRVAAMTPVIAVVTLRNMSGGKLTYFDSGVEQLFRINVTNAKNQIMPLTRYGRTVDKRQNVTGKMMRVQLEQGEQKTYRILINRMYDLTVPDVYKISLSKMVALNDLQKTMIQSNVAQVRVTGFNAASP